MMVGVFVDAGDDGSTHLCVSERQQRDIDLLPVMDKDDDCVSFVKNR
jgi:hypothetical protein